MKIKTIIYSLLLMALAGCIGESFIEEVQEDSSGTETVRIILSSATVDTKSAKDGDIMKNLRIWMVKKDETAVKYYSSTYPDASTKEVVFENVDRGEYTMYIIANSDLNSAYTGSSIIDDDFKNATLPELNDPKPPFDDNNGMPMSLIQEVKVTAGTNDIEAKLVRVCGKIRVTIYNRTADKKIYLSDLSFTGKNPSTGYLFFKDHAVPAGTSHGDFTSLSATTGAEAVSIDINEDKVVFEQYLYETGNIELGLNLKGALYPTGFSKVPNLAETTKEQWKFKDGNTTNTTIQTGDRWYIIANAQNQRIFLCDNGSTLAAEYAENNDDEFLVKMNKNENLYLKYLWNFSNTNNGSTRIRNYGTDKKGKYIQFNNSTIAMSENAKSVNTDINNNTRRFYYSSGSWRNYLYYDSGNLYLSNSNTEQTNRGWYLREMVKENTSVIQFTDTEADNFEHQTDELKYIDDFGAPVTLNEICRNQILDIHLNVFHSESTGKLYFEVTGWQNEENKNTTFD